MCFLYCHKISPVTKQHTTPEIPAASFKGKNHGRIIICKVPEPKPLTPCTSPAIKVKKAIAAN